MELNTEIIPTPPRDAATVVMLRDGSQGLEVFLVKRHGLSDVLGGAYVFPGGKVDPADAHPDLQARLDQPTQALHASLNEPALSHLTAASLFVAAVREAFEESGILFAHQAEAATTSQASALLREGLGFEAVLQRLGLQLQTSSILPWSRWITPKQPAVMSKRFDTRFFVACAPADQEARHDDHEVTHTVWLRPEQALRDYWSGAIGMVSAQIMSLSQLAHHATAADALQAAATRRPWLIEPEPFEHNGERVICYPGDPQHSVASPAWAGPTRLVFRNNRFEPLGGLASLLPQGNSG